MKKSKNINKSLTKGHSFEIGDYMNTPYNTYMPLATTALGSGMDLYNAFNSGEKYSQMAEPYEDEATEFANTQYDASSKDSLLKATAYRQSLGRVDDKDFGGHQDIFSAAAKGAVSGAMAGAFNPYVAAASALVNGALKGWSAYETNKNIDNQVKSTNEKLRRAEMLADLNLDYAIQNEDTMSDRMRQRSMMSGASQLGYAAFGGMLDTNGTDWSTDATYIDNGSTHQNNPFGGVQYGIASDGLPNLVEEGEVVIKVKDNQGNPEGKAYAKGGPMYSDYVLSNRVIPTLEELTMANITDKPEKYEGKPYAWIYKDLTKGIKETVNSPITKNYLESLHTRIARAQEDTKLREQQEEFMAELKKATPEQQDIILQQMGYASPLEEATMAAKGGKIHIAKNKRGTFTAAAKKRGMGVQEFASKVLANPENYTEAMRKKAQFAHNAKSFKHANGGYLFPWGGWANQDELNNYYTQQYTDFWNNLQGRKGSNVNRAYLTGAQARQWVNQLSQGDEQQQALATMLKSQWGDANTDWSNNATWEFKNKYNPSGTIVESSPYISWAGDNTAMKDALWGIRHTPQLSVDNRYQQGIYTPSTPEIILPEGPQSVNRYWTYDWDTGERTPISREEFENPEEGWFVDDTLEEYGPDNPDDANYYRDLYLTKKPYNTVPTDTDYITDNLIENNTGIASDMFLPIMSAIANIKGIQPDNSNARLIEKSVLPPRYVSYNPTGRYVQPVLTDTRLISSALNNQNNNILNAIADLSGTNRGQAMANIIGQNYLNQQNIGEARLKANTANYETLKDAAKINNEIDFNNAQMALNADEANQRAWDSYAGRFAQQRTAGAKMREDTANAVTAARSANWNNLLENIQAVMDNQRNRTMANDSLGRMYGYNIAPSGNITFNNINNKRKFANDYDINVKDVDKVRRRRRNGVTKFYLNGKELTRKGE